ncbi:MAG: hypothetical protein FD146_1736 [Anaerolineaceae bacterium]|nr:MAG: hypothetical protein FD146_1736 [Anaerolineaceae bacterium]
MKEFDLTPRATPGASATRTASGLRMEIPAGPRGTYRLAQFDDYARRPRRLFPHAPPRTLSLRARVSAGALPGTWGFGLWNDPFGLSLGFGGTTFRLPCLPEAAWFFYGSPENSLSLQPCHCERSEAISRHARGLLRRSAPRNDIPSSDFFAGTFAAPRIPSLLLAPAILGLPMLAIRPLSRWLRRLAGKLIRQDGASVRVDVTEWHDYKIEWQSRLCRFCVDDVPALETPLAPSGPLGLVIWLDNQYAAWGPDGRPGYGTLANPAAWLEVEELAIC